jgi:hypothetical protein
MFKACFKTTISSLSSYTTFVLFVRIIRQFTLTKVYNYQQLRELFNDHFVREREKERVRECGEEAVLATCENDKKCN